MKKFILIVIIFSISIISTAQFVRGPINIPARGVLNGVYIAENIPTKKVVPYTYIREADVMWSKRVWSVIDLRQKFNQPLYYPMDNIEDGMWNKNTSTWSLWTIIRYHVLIGDLTIYSPFNPNWESWTDGDMFKYPINNTFVGGNYYNDSIFREKVFMYLGTSFVDPNEPPLRSYLDPTYDSTIFINGIENVVYPAPDTAWFASQHIVQYKLKEDWFFDKERSVLERRIIGIAPIVYKYDANGNISGMRELFWLYFPECRYVFQNFFLASRNNDAQRMSLDDLFWKRMFHSFIVKESNIYDRDIDRYRAGIDALIESDQIKEDISNFEHDLWNY